MYKCVNVYDGFNKDDFVQFVTKYNNRSNCIVNYDYKNMLAAVRDNESNCLDVFNAININILDKLLKELNSCKIVMADLTNYKVEVGPIKGIKVFQKTNKLEKQDFNYKVAILNILEETLETLEEYESDNARDIAEEIFNKYFKGKTIANNEKLIDGFTDIRVMAIGETMKLGYEPKCTLAEVSKHINSRRGEIIKGKFIKSKKEKDIKKWYPVNFDKCRK